MPYYQISKIKEFDKFDLFFRYALDNLAGLMLGAESSNPLQVKFAYDETALKRRIDDVRSNMKRPDFSKMVSI